MMPFADIAWAALACAVVLSLLVAGAAKNGPAIVRKLRWIIIERRGCVRCGSLADLGRRIQSNNRKAGENK